MAIRDVLSRFGRKMRPSAKHQDPEESGEKAGKEPNNTQSSDRTIRDTTQAGNPQRVSTLLERQHDNNLITILRELRSHLEQRVDQHRQWSNLMQRFPGKIDDIDDNVQEISKRLETMAGQMRSQSGSEDIRSLLERTCQETTQQSGLAAEICSQLTTMLETQRENRQVSNQMRELLVSIQNQQQQIQETGQKTHQLLENVQQSFVTFWEGRGKLWLWIFTGIAGVFAVAFLLIGIGLLISIFGS